MISSTLRIFALVGVHLAAAFLALYLVEARVSSIKSKKGVRISTSEEDRIAVLVPDPYLHSTLRKNARLRARARYGRRPIYDVYYTTQEHGRRISPPIEFKNSPDCLLFFGGSFTFGEGVNDEETYPYRVGILAKERYQVHNFAAPSYGPHHTLAQLQSNQIENSLDCRVKKIFYLLILGHVPRPIALQRTHSLGPRYVLDTNGHLSRDGFLSARFAKPQFPGDSFLWGNLKKFLVSRYALARTILTKQEYSKAEFDFTVRILAESDKVIREKFPEAEFHIIFWDFGEAPIMRYMADSLRKESIAVHDLKDAEEFAGITRKQRRLHRYDGHPSTLAYDRLARFVVRAILELPVKETANH